MIKTPQDLYDIIETATGKSIENGDYGFINGTSAPFLQKGMASESLYPGFVVWKKENDGSYTELNITTIQSVEQNIKDIICFLLLSGMKLTFLFKNAKNKKYDVASETV